jgi:hypothetical protein
MIPKINHNFVTMRAKIAPLKGSNPAATVNPFSGIGIGVPLSSLAAVPLPTSGGLFVLKGDYEETTKKEIEDAFLAIKATIQNSGGGGVGALDVKVEKVIQRLGDIRGRVTGESYSKGGHVFSSMTEVGDWLVTKKVPVEECFGSSSACLFV